MHHPGTNNKVYKKINDNFEWSRENFKKISEIIKKYPSNRIQSAVIPFCLLYTSPSPRDRTRSRMPSSA